MYDLIYLRIVSIRRQRPTIIPVKPAMMTQPKTNPGKKSGAGTSSISKIYFILYEKKQQFDLVLESLVKLPLKFRKAGRVLGGGARETHFATCHNGETPSKTKDFLKSPCFSKSFW